MTAHLCSVSVQLERPIVLKLIAENRFCQNGHQNHDALCKKKKEELSIVHTLQASKQHDDVPTITRGRNHEEQHMQFVRTEWQTRVDVLAQESKYIW